ncbi:putative IS4 family transposase [Streptomyces viridochromogenes Tue57]|uniref:Putative IS4 family transposase n=1 Tax=Streptomyces viridochromogenes Tue57 TaxID=1160705 RepID=L8NYI6_STRVR|nr:putative IS4 family transposase [Streptomyces viridochromogenes Tue57]
MAEPSAHDEDLRVVAYQLMDAAGLQWDAVLIVDDTGFLKKGVRSAGVQRQCSGTAGRTENCQIGVFLAHAAPAGRTLMDRCLYLLTSWTDDRERCRRAGIDDTVVFETKVAMARAMVRRAIADRVPFRWVTADAAYGFSRSRRSELERADVFHVVATTRHDTVVTRWAIDHPVHDLFPGLPRQKWRRRSCGDGAHGRRIYDWARVEVRPWHRVDRRHWVLARRSVSRPEEISYYIAYRPAETTLDQLIHIAGSRWAIEECFQSAKQECGLDDYQVRRYPGWHRHMSLAMAAHSCLTVLRASQLIHLSLAEMRRLITRLTDRRPTPVEPIMQWSTWRRRRQRQARTSHYKRR